MNRFFLTIGLSILVSFLSCASVKNEVTKPEPTHIIDTLKTTTVDGIDFEFAGAKHENGILTVTLNATSNNKDRVIAIFKDNYNKKEAVIKYYVGYKEHNKRMRVALIDDKGNEFTPETIMIGNNKVERNSGDYGSIFNLCKNTLYDGTKTKIEFTFKVEKEISLISLITFDFYRGQYIRDKSPELIFNVKLRNLKLLK